MYGGRWNSPGSNAVYLGDSLALAAMELLVHVRSVDVLAAYRKMPVFIPEPLVAQLDVALLPTNWTGSTAPATLTQAIGDDWLTTPHGLLDGESPLPSAVLARRTELHR